MYSPAYLTPFALYGSGTRRRRIFAATSPTTSLSTPETLSFCGVSTVNVMPAGGSISIGCENPSASWSFLPCSTARYPVPLISRSFVKPVVTPATMFAMSVRVSPCSARFCLLSSARVTVIFPSSRAIEMFSWNVRASWPFGPFTVMVCPSSFTSTPLGTATGMRPIRLIRSPHVREDLATEAFALRLTTGHHAGGGRDDHHAQPAEDARHLRLARVHPKARLADAANPRNGRQLAHELQPKEDLAGARLLVARDEAFVAEDARDLELGPARRNAHRLMARARGVANAREHVGHRVVRHPDALRPGFLGRRRGLARRSVGPVLPGLLAHAAHLLFGQHAHLYLPHQLDFVTPGNSPISARSRKQIRHKPNIRMYPRGRPQISQRWCVRTLNLGVRRDFRMRLFFAIEYLSGRSSERHPEAAQQRAALFVRSRRGHNRDLHAAQAIDLVVVDLREDELLFQPKREVASAVEALVRHTLEVADARERDGDELLEEVPHPLAAKRDLEPDRHPDAKAEVRDGLSRLRDDRALPGDRREVSRCGVHRLRVADRLAHSDVEDDLLDLRDLHHVRVAELLAQLALHGRVIPLFQHGGHEGSSTTIASPHCRHTRSFVPSSSRRWPMRVGLPQCGQTTMTLPRPDRS